MPHLHLVARGLRTVRPLVLTLAIRAELDERTGWISRVAGITRIDSEGGPVLFFLLILGLAGYTVYVHTCHVGRLCAPPSSPTPWRKKQDGKEVVGVTANDEYILRT